MIEQPPYISALPMPAVDSEELKEVITAINSRYLYWSDIKYRVPQGMSPVD